MNKELKEQAHKEFEEKKLITGAMWLVKMWEKNKNNTEIEIELPEHIKDEFKSFIDSLIDKTVQMTKERVVLFITNLDNETIPRQEVLVCTHTDSMDSMCSKCILELNDDIYRKGYNCAVLKIQEKLKESLITNKSDINK